MKRDLEIAREIQSWLVPSFPPEIPGAEVAFGLAAANSVAGDYYDAFFRDHAGYGWRKTSCLVIADVAGKSIPAALADGHAASQPCAPSRREGASLADLVMTAESLRLRAHAWMAGDSLRRSLPSTSRLHGGSAT